MADTSAADSAPSAAQDTQAGDIAITVRSLSAENLKFNLPATTTIEELKKLISERDSEKIAIDRIRLIFSGRILENAKSLTDYNIKDKSIINFSRVLEQKSRPRPGPGTTTSSTAAPATTGANTSTPSFVPRAPNAPNSPSAGHGANPFAAFNPDMLGGGGMVRFFTLICCPFFFFASANLHHFHADIILLLRVHVDGIDAVARRTSCGTRKSRTSVSASRHDEQSRNPEPFAISCPRWRHGTAAAARP